MTKRSRRFSFHLLKLGSGGRILKACANIYFVRKTGSGVGNLVSLKVFLGRG